MIKFGNLCTKMAKKPVSCSPVNIEQSNELFRVATIENNYAVRLIALLSLQAGEPNILVKQYVRFFALYALRINLRNTIIVKFQPSPGFCVVNY